MSTTTSDPKRTQDQTCNTTKLAAKFQLQTRLHYTAQCHTTLHDTTTHDDADVQQAMRSHAGTQSSSTCLRTLTSSNECTQTQTRTHTHIHHRNTIPQHTKPIPSSRHQDNTTNIHNKHVTNVPLSTYTFTDICTLNVHFHITHTHTHSHTHGRTSHTRSQTHM